MMHQPLLIRGEHAASLRQQGQALAEGLFAMMALAVLWVGLHWLAHYQDAALSAQHASRHVAFTATRDQPEPGWQALGAPFFTGPAHRWTDRRGQAVIEADRSVQLSTRRLQPLSIHAQPGRATSNAHTLRRDWALEDPGILQATVMLDPGAGAVLPQGHESTLLKLAVFDLPYPPLVRHTHILTGAGHAISDSAAQDRVGDSSLAWSAAYAASRSSGRAIQQRAAGVDAAWGRPDLDFNWLQRWSGRVPGHLIVAQGSADERRN